METGDIHLLKILKGHRGLSSSRFNAHRLEIIPIATYKFLPQIE
uniref:Uncharacterized protein n=1 Tax=Manihot esculenta TaxID=3983 RepID=A0A2C9UBD1_MANES